MREGAGLWETDCTDSLLSSMTQGPPLSRMFCLPFGLRAGEREDQVALEPSAPCPVASSPPPWSIPMHDALRAYMLVGAVGGWIMGLVMGGPMTPHPRPQPSSLNPPIAPESRRIKAIIYLAPRYRLPLAKSPLISLVSLHPLALLSGWRVERKGEQSVFLPVIVLHCVSLSHRLTIQAKGAGVIGCSTTPPVLDALLRLPYPCCVSRAFF